MGPSCQVDLLGRVTIVQNLSVDISVKQFYPISETFAKVHLLHDGEEGPVQPIKGLFLVKANHGCQILFLINIFEGVSDQEQVVHNGKSRYIASLIRVDYMLQSRLQLVCQQFATYFVVYVEQRNGPLVSEAVVVTLFVCQGDHCLSH